MKARTSCRHYERPGYCLKYGASCLPEKCGGFPRRLSLRRRARAIETILVVVAVHPFDRARGYRWALSEQLREAWSGNYIRLIGGRESR